MICDKIRTLRDTCGLSQSALAKKIGVTRSAVNAWEMGLSIPTAQYIVAMAQLFHISTDYLLGLQNSQAIYLDGLTEQEKQLRQMGVIPLQSARSGGVITASAARELRRHHQKPPARSVITPLARDILEGLVP